MTTEFLITAIIIVLTPGAGVIFTLAAGLSQGRRASFVAAAGCTLGILPHVLAAATGLAAILHSSAVAFQTLKYLGVLYLLYMAWVMFTEEGALEVVADSPAQSTTRVIRSAVLINLLNPKLTIFFFAFLPQFVPAGEPGAFSSMMKLSAVFMLLTFVVFCAYGAMAASARDYVIRRPVVMTWIRRFLGGTFGILAARLATAHR